MKKPCAPVLTQKKWNPSGLWVPHYGMCTSSWGERGWGLLESHQDPRRNTGWLAGCAHLQECSRILGSFLMVLDDNHWQWPSWAVMLHLRNIILVEGPVWLVFKTNRFKTRIYKGMWHFKWNTNFCKKLRFTKNTMCTLEKKQKK